METKGSMGKDKWQASPPTPAPVRGQGTGEQVVSGHTHFPHRSSLTHQSRQKPPALALPTAHDESKQELKDCFPPLEQNI